LFGAPAGHVHVAERVATVEAPPAGVPASRIGIGGGFPR
jgi:hypothetical protein